MPHALSSGARRVKEIDPSSGEVEEDGYEDEYQLEELEVTPGDYVKPVLVPNFRKSWWVGSRGGGARAACGLFGVLPPVPFAALVTVALLCSAPPRREELDPDTERADEYGLGPREGLQEAVEAVIGTLGMQPCEGTEAVPPNARSHTVLLAGTFVGNQQVRTC